MKLSKLFVTFLLFILLQSCNKEKSDEALLEKDRVELTENLYTEKVLTYKMGKICIRSAVANENTTPEFKKISTNFANINSKIIQNGKPSFDKLSVLDYITLYREYSIIKDFIKTTDEDDFPTLFESLNVLNDKTKPVKKPVFLMGAPKIEAQNIEHGILSAIVILSKDFGFTN